MDRILLLKTLLDSCDQWKNKEKNLENKSDIAEYKCLHRYHLI